jgi:hypothetical protein
MFSNIFLFRRKVLRGNLERPLGQSRTRGGRATPDAPKMTVGFERVKVGADGHR